MADPSWPPAARFNDPNWTSNPFSLELVALGSTTAGSETLGNVSCATGAWLCSALALTSEEGTATLLNASSCGAVSLIETVLSMGSDVSILEPDSAPSGSFEEMGTTASVGVLGARNTVLDAAIEAQVFFCGAGVAVSAGAGFDDSVGTVSTDDGIFTVIGAETSLPLLSDAGCSLA